MTTANPNPVPETSSASAIQGGASDANAAFNTATVPSTASLYVGELHPEVTEAMLYEIFSQIGPVSSIRICRDAITRRSLGYAYVNFHSQADGERAIETLNYSLIKGHPCRIMWSQRDPSLRRSGQGNVFIKSLDKSIDNKALHDTFSVFGNILSCKVVCDESGASKGYGFVHFETQEAADEAIAKVNGMLLNDTKVYVGRHQSRRERMAVMEAVKNQFTNIFVKNLDTSVTDEQLKALFVPFGSILSAVVQKDSETGDSLGYGFVNFDTHDSAQAAVDALNGKNFAGKDLYVGRAQKKSERVEELRYAFEALKLERSSKLHGSNVYVKNLAESVDDDRLRIEFSPFGTITSCKVMLDEKGNSRGFGFVCFSTSEEAGRAITEMNSRMLLGKPLYVSLAQRRDERRAQLEAQFSARAQQLRFHQQQQAAVAAAAMMGLIPPPPTAAQASSGAPGMMPGSAFLPFSPQQLPYFPGMPHVPPTSAAAFYQAANQQQAGLRPSNPAMMMAGGSGAPVVSGVSQPPRPYMMRQQPYHQGPSQSQLNSQQPMSRIPPHLQSSSMQPGAGRMQPPPYVPRHLQGQQNSNPNPNPNGMSRRLPSASAPYQAQQQQPAGVMPYGNTPNRYGGMPRSYPPMAQQQLRAPYGGMASSSNARTPPTGQSLTAALANAAPEQQKRLLGERLYPLVHEQVPEHAAKITGMLLEMDNAEVLGLLDSFDALKGKVGEALAVLRKHQQQQPKPTTA